MLHNRVKVLLLQPLSPPSLDLKDKDKDYGSFSIRIHPLTNTPQRYFFRFPNDAIYCFRDISRYKTLNPELGTGTPAAALPAAPKVADMSTSMSTLVHYMIQYM